MNPEIKARLLSLELWLAGLWSAFVVGGSTAILASLGVTGANAAGVNIATLSLKQIGAIGLSGALVRLLQYISTKPLPGGIVSMLMVGLLFTTGCASAPKDAPNAEAQAPIVAAIKTVDKSANEFLANPFVQIGAQPAGMLLTYAALWSYTLSGGDDVEGLAGQICSWCVLANGILGGTVLTPADIDRVGQTFDSQLNASDPKFSPAFGPVQAQFKRAVSQLGPTTTLARETMLKFVMGVNAAATKFCK